MLSGVLVMAVVAGALAFKVKTPNVCAYTSVVAAAPATTVGILTHATNVTTQRLTATTTVSSFYASTSIKTGETCPSTIPSVPRFKTLAAE